MSARRAGTTGPSAGIWGRRLLVAFALAAALWVVDVGHGANPADEAWFLQVLARVGAGDALYEQVSLGVPPLSVWVALPATELLGVDVGVLKAVTALVLAGTVLAAVVVARMLRIGRLGRALVVLASIAYIALPLGLYTQLSYLLVLLALAATLAWRARASEGCADAPPARRLLLAAGALGGLAAAAKHSEGLYACLAVTATVIAASPRPAQARAGRARDVAVALAAAAAAFTVPMIPVIVAGDLGAFVNYAVDKGPYIERASISYLDGFDQLAQLAADPLGQTRLLLLQAAVLIPPLAVGALLLSARRDRAELVPVAAFTIAAIAGIFPRADLAHVLPAIPICALPIAWGASRASRLAPARYVRLAGGLVGSLLLATAAWSLLATPVRALQASQRLGKTRHFHGALVPAARDRTTAEVAEGLQEAHADAGATLVISPFAGYYYLASGLPNPSSFDYPLITAFRGGDQRKLIAEIESGEIARVCLGGFERSPVTTLRPDEVIDFVSRRMTSLSRLGLPSTPGQTEGCTLYRLDERTEARR